MIKIYDQFYDWFLRPMFENKTKRPTPSSGPKQQQPRGAKQNPTQRLACFESLGRGGMGGEVEVSYCSSPLAHSRRVGVRFRVRVGVMVRCTTLGQIVSSPT